MSGLTLVNNLTTPIQVWGPNGTVPVGTNGGWLDGGKTASGVAFGPQLFGICTSPGPCEPTQWGVAPKLNFDSTILSSYPLTMSGPTGHSNCAGEYFMIFVGNVTWVLSGPASPVTLFNQTHSDIQVSNATDGSGYAPIDGFGRCIWNVFGIIDARSLAPTTFTWGIIPQSSETGLKPEPNHAYPLFLVSDVGSPVLSSLYTMIYKGGNCWEITMRQISMRR